MTARALASAFIFILAAEADISPALARQAGYCATQTQDYRLLYGVCGGANCSDPVDPYDFISAAWERTYLPCVNPSGGYCPGGDPAACWDGFPLNLHLSYGLASGDYPPISNDVRLGTCPLVPGGGSGRIDASMYPDRSTLGPIDLVTGVPLISESDFELEFGGAVFRHVRTYSEAPARGNFLKWGDVGCYQPYEADLFWDWCGQGWMLGTNPILLFDASWAGRVATGSAVEQSPPRCYFVMDAHHAIPFERIEQGSGLPSYIAGDGFDALLTIDESSSPPPAFNNSTHEWSVLPQRVFVWLHGRSVKYTIEIQYRHDLPMDFGDVRPIDADDDGVIDGSMHDRPVFPGGTGLSSGVPYWGRVSSIEDSYGHRVEMEYCRSRQELVSWTGTSDPNTNCRECTQNTPERGQLRLAKLRASGEVAWTIVYVHRSFDPRINDPLSLLLKPNHQQNALHSCMCKIGRAHV